MLILRADQSHVTEQLRAVLRAGKRAPLLQAATGWGKTVWFSSVVKTAIEKKKRVLILCHREELLDQISETLDQFEVEHSFIAAGYGCNPFAPVQVASVFSLIRRLSKTIKPDLIISDESHHCIKTSTWGRILQHYADVLRIGVTATPYRVSGEPLGDLFDCLIQGPSVRELIDQKILADYRLFAPTTVALADVPSRGGDYVKADLSALMDRPTITGDAVATYKKFAEGKRAVAFCVSVQHAHHTAEAFTAAGFTAMALDGEMEKVERRRRVGLFRTGRIQILTSCDILSEGFDVKGIEVGIFLRPTQSLTLWLQQLGRCLRVMDGKQFALLFDHANNALRLGLPDGERNWSLDGDQNARSKKPQKVPVRQCMKCYAVVPAAQRQCKWCGTVFEIKPREVKLEEGELQEIDMASMERLFNAKVRRQEQGRAQSYEELKRIEKQRGYKPGWAKHVMEAKESKRKKGPLELLADEYRP